MHAECLKKRKQIVQQIEIKMVDDFQDKRISDFMYRGIENEGDPAAQAETAAPDDDTASVATEKEKSSSAGNTLRKMS